MRSCRILAFLLVPAACLATGIAGARPASNDAPGPSGNAVEGAAPTTDAGSAAAPARPVAPAAPVSAADPLDWGDQANRRALNGHFFLPSEAVTDPFTTTHFGSATAFGYGRFDMTVQDDQGNPQDLRLKIAAIQQAMELQVQFAQAGPASFAIRARASGSAAVGVNAESALYVPLTVGYDYGVGLAIKPWGNRWFQFAVSLDYLRGTTYTVSPMQALANSLDSGTLTTRGLLTTETVNQVAPALSLAVSPYRLLGLVTTIRYAWSRPEGGAADAQVLDWGAALGLDIGAVSKAPIGIQGMYRLEKGLDGQRRLLHYGGGGLFYTGRRNLALGAEVQVTRSSPGAGIDQLLIMGQFRLRYYW